MNTELVRYFVKVIQNGSFSKAAILLKVPKSTVSKAITRLEKETGTKLILRTTRSLTLTASGKVFYESCLGPIQALEDAQKSLYGSDSILSGVVKVTAPEDLGNQVIAPAIGELTRKHPDLSFELRYSDEVIDLVKDGFDIAIRIGKLNESGLKAKKLGEVILILVASPSYLRSQPKVQSPNDLLDHQCLSYGSKSAVMPWLLKGKEKSVKVPIKARITSNQMSSLLQAAATGAGIALVPHFLCREALATGKIVRVLPGWSSPGLPVSMVSPLSLASSVRLKMSGAHIFAAIQKAFRADI